MFSVELSRESRGTSLKLSIENSSRRLNSKFWVIIVQAKAVIYLSPIGVECSFVSKGLESSKARKEDVCAVIKAIWAFNFYTQGEEYVFASFHCDDTDIPSSFRHYIVGFVRENKALSSTSQSKAGNRHKESETRSGWRP